MAIVPLCPGIYSIRNTANGKLYVGSTTLLRYRFSDHVAQLKRGTHDNSRLQADFSVQDEEAFIIEVLEECVPDALEAREQYWSDALRSCDWRFGYNFPYEIRRNKPMTPKDQASFVGARFGRWTVIEHLPNRNRRVMFLCRCDCGTERAVLKGRLLDPGSGGSKSCGCFMRDEVKVRARKHGESYTPEYRAWIQMKSRCNNANKKWYHRYGGRGITYCQRWNDFTLFLADVGRRPSSKHSFDRIDNDGNYEPDNVKWSTQGEQVRNSTHARMLSFNGETLCMADWAKKLGIHPVSLLYRLDRYKWPLEEALTTPGPNKDTGRKQK